MRAGLKASDPTIHVLAPEKDIDHYYLGEATDATELDRGTSTEPDVGRLLDGVRADTQSLIVKSLAVVSPQCN
jgi:hypothetical protein